MRPLEERFPTLYYNIVHERVAGKDAVEEKRVPKETPPSLFDVVEAVCSTHRVTDVGMMKDLTAAISEFAIAPFSESQEKLKAKLEASEKQSEGKKKSTKESEN